MKTKERNGLPKSQIWNGAIIAALIAAVAVFGVMLQMEKNVLTQYEKGVIFVAKKEIPKGLMITETNYWEYMEQRELDKSCIPPTALTDVTQINKLVTIMKLEQGVLLTKGMFQEENLITANMQEPVIAGFKVEDIYQVAGGTLRAGDRIHVYNVDESGYAILTWENVFVQEVFDSAGKAISNGDEVSVAQRVNIYMDKADAERFYTELAMGSLRAVKVCD